MLFKLDYTVLMVLLLLRSNVGPVKMCTNAQNNVIKAFVLMQQQGLHCEKVAVC